MPGSSEQQGASWPCAQPLGRLRRPRTPLWGTGQKETDVAAEVSCRLGTSHLTVPGRRIAAVTLELGLSLSPTPAEGTEEDHLPHRGPGVEGPRQSREIALDLGPYEVLSRLLPGAV